MNILATNTVPISSVSSVRKSSKLSRKKSSTKQTHKVKQCPEGKELNPVTGRCRNKCPSNKERNTKGNCVVKMKNNKRTSKTKTKTKLCRKYPIVGMRAHDARAPRGACSVSDDSLVGSKSFIT